MILDVCYYAVTALTERLSQNAWRKRYFQPMLFNRINAEDSVRAARTSPSPRTFADMNGEADNKRLAGYFLKRAIELLEEAKAEDDPIRKLELEKRVIGLLQRRATKLQLAEGPMTYRSFISWIYFFVGEVFGDLTLDRFGDRKWPYRIYTYLIHKSSDWQGDSPNGPWTEP